MQAPGLCCSVLQMPPRLELPFQRPGPSAPSPAHGQRAFSCPPEAQCSFPTTILRSLLEHALDGIGFFEYMLGDVALLFGPSREVHERPLVPWGQIPFLP